MPDQKAISSIAIAETLVWAGLYYSFPALFIRWEADFGWSKPELTGAITVALIASAVSSPFFGSLIDRGRGPLVLTASAAVGGVLMVLLSLVQSLWQFYLVWAALGIAMGGCLYEPCFAFLTRARGEGATHAITLVTLVAGFAGTLSFPLGHMVSEADDWRAAVVAYGVLILIVAVPLMGWATRRMEPAAALAAVAEEPHETAPTNGRHLRRSAFWLLALGFTLAMLSHAVVLNHLLPLLTERGVAAETAVLTAAMIGPMQVAGRIAMILASRHVSMVAIMLACFAGIAVATLFLIGAGAAPALLAGFIVLQGASAGVLSIVKPAITRQVMGRANFGAVAGAMAVPYLLGVAFAPFLGSLIWLVGGYGLVLPVIFAFAVAGGLACYWATRRPAKST